MLVVTRKQGESIIIGENIEVSILEVGEGNIKIGINAPKNVRILRKELISEVEKENKQSINNLGELIKRIR